MTGPCETVAAGPSDVGGTAEMLARRVFGAAASSDQGWKRRAAGRSPACASPLPGWGRLG